MNRENYNAEIELSKTHWWYVSRLKIIKSVLKKYFKKNDRDNILEIGCGSGANFNLLSKYGVLEAVELDRSVRDYANSKKFIKVKYGKLPNDVFLKKKYNTIFLFDVLEHVQDDQLSLINIFKALNISGKIVLTVPAFMFLWSKHDDSSNHKRRYNKSQIIQLLEKCGFTIIYSSYFNFFLFPLILTIRLMRKITRNKKEENDFKKENSFTNYILKFIFSLESFFIPLIYLPFGVSIIVVAKKK